MSISIAGLVAARRHTITAYNLAQNAESAHGIEAEASAGFAEVVADTEREIARAKLMSTDDILAAAGVLAEMVLTGQADDGRDEALARNILAALSEESP